MSTLGATRFEIQDEGGSVVGSSPQNVLDRIEASVKASAESRRQLVEAIVRELPTHLVRIEMARPHLIILVRTAWLHADNYGIGRLRPRVLVDRRTVQVSIIGQSADGAEYGCGRLDLDRVRGVMIESEGVAG